MLVLVGLCVGVAGLYFAQEFIKPIAIAFLLCFVLAPASNRLERQFRFNRTLSVITVVSVSLMVIVGAGWVIGSQVSALAGEVPRYTRTVERKLSAVRSAADRVISKLDMVRREAGGHGGETSRAASQPASQPVVVNTTSVSPKPTDGGPFDIGSAPWRDLTGIFAPVLTMLGTGLVIAVFVVFMLVQREDLRDRLIRLLSRRHIGVTTQALDDAATRISHYLRVLCLVNICYGVVLGTGMYFAGLPAPVLWGIICMLLRFVPYVGPMVAAAFPLTLAVAVDSGWGMFFWTAALFGCVELFTANFIEPLIYGKHTGVSPMAVILSAAFWGWLWGIEGLLMATPLTLCLAVAGRHVPSLGFLNVLLGDEPALPVHLRYYQRLVAGDDREATVLLRSAAEQGGLAGAFDEAVLPALAIAEGDARAGRIPPEHFRKILRSLRAQVDTLAEQERSAAVVRDARGEAAVTACKAVPPSAEELRPQPLPVRDPSKRESAVRRGLVRLRMHRSRRRAMAGQASPDRPLTNSYAPILPLPRGCHPRVLILPARDEPDEIAGVMLAHVLRIAGYEAQTMRTESLATEMVAEAQDHGADLIVVSATPPAAVASARYLLKKLSAAEGDLPPVLVTLWSMRNRRHHLMRSFRGDARVPVVHSVCEAAEEVRQLTAHLMASVESR